MANSKTQAVKRKHLARQRAAKERVRQHLSGKMESGKLPELAQRFLRRRLRTIKRG